MPGWFDIRTLGDVTVRQDEDGILKSVNLVHKLITEEVDSGIPADRIIVGGFSQGVFPSFAFLISGAAISLLAGYSCERKLAGVVGLSGWLPLHNKFAAVMTPNLSLSD
jgi:predicted esterase